MLTGCGLHNKKIEQQEGAVITSPNTSTCARDNLLKKDIVIIDDLVKNCITKKK